LQVVRQRSATFDSPGVQNIGLPVDHSGLNKFKSRSTEYKLVLNALVALIEESRHIVQHHLDDSVLQNTVSVYVERNVLSRMLESKLQALREGSDILHAVILSGLGGSGKSQLVLRYVETHKRRYSHIFWVDAATKELTFESFRAIGQDLKLEIYEKSNLDPQEPVLENRVVLEVLKWFRQASGKEANWLVIIDNADDITWGIESLIPRGAKGSIIITSRNVDFTKLLTNVESLAVGNMEVEEAISLLLKGVDLALENAPTDILAIAKSIAEALDYLPLALDLARAYVADVKRTETAENALSTYLKDFQRHQDEILGDKFFAELTTYEKTVRVVWDTSFDTVHRQNSNSTAMLTLLSFLNREHIQEELFRLASIHLFRHSNASSSILSDLPEWLSGVLTVTEDRDWDSYEFRRLLRPLISHSLIHPTRSGKWGGFKLHGLVQWRARQVDKEEPWMLWSFYIVVTAANELRSSRNMEFRRELIPHLRVLNQSMQSLDQIRRPENFFDLSGMLYDIVANIYTMEGMWSAANETLSKVWETGFKGRYCPDMLSIMMQWSSLWSNIGRWDVAESLMQLHERIAKMVGNEGGDKNELLLHTRQSLGLNYGLQGKLKEAEEILADVFDITNKTYGPDDLRTLSAMSNLAVVYEDRGRWKDAQEIFDLVRDKRLKSLGKNNEDTLTSMMNSAVSLLKQKRLDEAEYDMLEVLELGKEVLGEYHYFTITTMLNLAQIYAHQDRFQEAEELNSHVAKFREETLGLNHPDTLTIKINLVALYLGQGRLVEAEILLNHDLEAADNVLGEQHPTLMHLQAMRVKFHELNGRWEEAEQLQVQLVEKRTAILGPQHPQTVIAMMALGSMYKERERWIDAEIVLLNAATAAHSAFGVEHPNFWAILRRLIELYMETKSFGMALQMAKTLCGVQYSALGAAHVKTFESSLLLALVYQAQDMHREAEEVILSIIAAGSESLEEDHPVILHAIEALATVYREVRMWKPAAEWEQRLLNHRITKLGGDHPETLRSMAELGWCLLKLEQWAEAEDLLVKVLEAKRVDKDIPGAEGLHSVLLLDLGLVYMRQQKLEDAEKVLLEALEIAETGDSQDKDCSYSAAGYLQEIYESTGRLKEAQDLQRYKDEMKETMEKKTADYFAKVQRRQQHE